MNENLISKLYGKFGFRKPTEIGDKGEGDNWRKTEMAEERISDSPYFYEEKAGLIPRKKEKFFLGYPTISRDTKINGGISIGEEPREAIIVDDTTDSKLLSIFNILLERRKTAMSQGKDFKKGLLNDVYQLAGEIIPYNMNRVHDLVSTIPTPDYPIRLSEFFGGGVCRHQALLIGYLLEKLRDMGYVEGTTSIDRNFIPDKGGHTWVRYTNSSGRVIILDLAQKFLGNLDEIKSEEDRWFYERPLEKKGIFKRMINLFGGENKHDRR